MSTTNKIYFKNAPIKEAVCTFNLKETLTENDVNGLVRKLTPPNAPYEILEEEPVLSIQFVSKPTFVETKSTRIKSKKGDKIVQLNFNSISVHQLGKYTKWSDFSKQVMKVLNELANKKEIHSISLKKINSFVILAEENPSDYFNYYPEFDNQNYFGNRNLNQLQLQKRLKDHSQISLKFINKPMPEKYQRIIIDISTNINLIKEKIYTNDINEIEDSLSFYNNELYKSFISVLKNKAIDTIK